jgi:putative phage-type endonuclease
MTEQGTAEWHQERVGIITMSRASDVNAFDSRSKTKDKPLKARTDYILELATGRITGKPKVEIKAKALEHGKLAEPKARAAYQAKTGNLVDTVGFILHPRYPYIGASADWIMDDDDGGEIKCPIDPKVHLQTLIEGMPEEHIAQCQGNMFVSGRKRWHFISYNESFPPHLQLYIETIERDEEYIKKLEVNCVTLNWEVEQIVQQIKSKYEVQI